MVKNEGIDLSGLLAPQSVALVGASENKGFGYWTAHNLLLSADRLRVYFIHPTREAVMGVSCHRSISQLPEVVDCVIIATARERVNPILEEAGRKGIRNAVVYASGYTEEHTEEGARLEAELAGIAARYNINLLGPNCMGIINNLQKLNMLGLETAKDAFEREPLVGVIGQSGALANIFMKREGFPVGYQITVGNSAVLAAEDFLEYLAGVDELRAIAVYMESVSKPAVFYRALKKAALARKPVIILKAGRSQKAAQSAASHTGRLAGSHKAFRAALKKFGAISVDSMEELLCLSQAFAAIGPNLPKAPGVASYNLSGGANILSAECAEDYGLSLPALQPETLAEIARHIPSYATPDNPLDATTDLFGQTQRIVGVLKALDSDPNVGLITITQDIADKATEIVHGMVEAVVEGKRQGVQKPVFFNCLTEMTRNDAVRKQLAAAGVGLLSTMPVAYRCLRLLIDFAMYDPAQHTLKAPALVPGGKQASYALNESDSKAEMRACGVRTPAEVLLHSVDDIAGNPKIVYPCVMKIQSPDILHKTDIGGVKLDIRTPEQAAEAYGEIMDNVGRASPGAFIEGVVAQEMAKPGLEMLIGISEDPQLGHMVLAGIGGVLAELTQDVAMLPVPVNETEALAMLDSLQYKKLLDGYRGSAPVDKPALAKIIVAVSEYAAQNAAVLGEIDLNPVIAYPKGEGVIAVDALVIKRRAE